VVAAVGVLHTLVPDHWLPITILARQQGWTRRQVARSAAIAGSGHTISTLFIAILAWILGAAIAARFGSALIFLSSFALIAFGGWIAVSSLREMREHGHGHFGHSHRHYHADGAEHSHYHEHHADDWHVVGGSLALEVAPMHEHPHKTSWQTGLLLILGSSPMIEGIPAFFAASKYGVWQLAIMALVFAAATIGTYIAMCLLGSTGLEYVRLGRLEKYGEVLSGAFIALVGLVFVFIA
jgi:ABC-type nickel/cobalt efflux system permease component RcnA